MLTVTHPAGIEAIYPLQNAPSWISRGAWRTSMMNPLTSSIMRYKYFPSRPTGGGIQAHSGATLARASPDHHSCFLSSKERDALPSSSAALLAVPGSVSPSAALESGCEKDRYVPRRRRDTQESHCCQSTPRFAQVSRPMLQADAVSYPTASPPDALQLPSVVHAPVVSDAREQVGFVPEAAASSLSSCSF